MKKKRRVSLSTQINLIFTTISLVTSVLFVIIFRQTIISFSKTQAKDNFILFSETLALTKKDEAINSEFYYYVSFELDENRNVTSVHRDMLKDSTLDIDDIESFYNTYIIDIKNKDQGGIYEFLKHKFFFVYVEDEPYLIITIADNTYEKILQEPLNNIIHIGFIALIILGNAIILLWSSIIIERIKQLETSVTDLSSSSYKTPIEIEGSDEITDLAKAIELMREEIMANEETKQEMLQNLSHDIKTPIAVIKSYSEAIKDGISEPSEIDVVLKQTDILSSKVAKLLEWNRLEFITEKDEFYPVDIRRIINVIANNYNYKRDIKFELDLDNSYLIGLDDYYFTMVANIVENALRYAKSIIKITLKDRKITIYNDGESIDSKFIDNEFKPYEKGHKGQFGLGLTIVQKTCNLFDLSLKVENINDGVQFTIEPN